MNYFVLWPDCISPCYRSVADIQMIRLHISMPYKLVYICVWDYKVHVSLCHTHHCINVNPIKHFVCVQQTWLSQYILLHFLPVANLPNYCVFAT